MYHFNNTPFSGLNTSTSNISEDYKTSHDKSTLTLSVTIILAVFIVVAIFGNGLVCLAFYRQPRLRRVSYYPILSLAIADLLCGALAMPAYIAKKHVTEGGWLEGVTCDVFRFTYFFTEYASVVSLTAISIERFMSIKMPLTHRTWLTKRKMTAALVLCWFDAAVVSALPFFWQTMDEKEPCKYKPTKEWSIMVILANVFFPFLIMFWCHAKTISYALHSRKIRNTMQTTGRRSRQQEFKKASVLTRDRDLTCTFTIVVGVFVFCWGPSSLYYFIQIVCPQCFGSAFKPIKRIVNATVKLLTFANSSLNPLIYCRLNRCLREAFYETICGRFRARRRIVGSR